ncbi:MAG: hypothetical protein E6G97_13665 [Alphaproteobacteria bacterium]|nr:MAG: hypothetical protein E6G97_13665 [Alphaproteobacteria bacterium]
MSDPGSLPRWVAGYSTTRQFILTAIGILLLAPGACSLVFIAGQLLQWMSTGRFDEFIGFAALVWVVSAIIALPGILLIGHARRSAGDRR